MKNNSILKKILILIFIYIILIILFPHKVKANLTDEQGQTIANFAIGYVTNGRNNNLLVYSQDNRNKGYLNQLSSHNGSDDVNASFQNKLAFDCSSFVAFVFKETTGIQFVNYVNGSFNNTWTTVGYNSDANNSNTYLYKVGNYGQVDLKCGDILWKKGHVALYVGNNKVAEASSPENGLKISNIYSFSEVYRLNMTVDSVRGYENYTWPNGENYEWSDIEIDSNTTSKFKYQGTANGVFGYHDFNIGWIINKLRQLLDWFVGIVTYLIRMVFVGWTSLIESLANGIIEWTTGEDASLTIEKLVNNEVSFLDVNFFNYKTPGGQTLDSDSVMYVIRKNIAAWYYIIRNLSIILLLITLLYIGIRMAISSVAEQKAKYKNMLVSWVVSFVIVFGIHYVMIFILNINSSLIEIIKESFSGAEESLYDTVRNGSYTIQASVGWKSLIFYMILVYLLIRFLFVYIKRFLVVAILTFAAPFIGVLYSIDKIKDNKSQSFSRWLKEYFFNVIIQSVHALLYGLFMTVAFNIAGDSSVGIIFALLLINFMLKAESIFKSIFGIKSGSMKDVLRSSIAISSAGTVASKFVRANVRPIKALVRPVTSPISDIVKGTINYRKMDKIEKIKNEMINNDVQKESARLSQEWHSDLTEDQKAEIKAEGLAPGDQEYEQYLKSYGIDTDYEKLARNNINENDYREIATKQVELQQNVKKEYKKQMMSQTLNTIKGVGMATVAIPTTVVSGAADGLAVAVNAKKSLNKGINGYCKQNKNYISDSKVKDRIKDLATVGLYTKIKNVKLQDKDYKKKIENQINNAKYEVENQKLEKEIDELYDKLSEDPTIDIKELEKAVNIAEYTVSKQEIQNILYKQEITVNIKMENIDTYKDISKNIKYKEKEVDFDKVKFNRNMDKAIKNLISKEDGIKKRDIKNDDIIRKFDSLVQEKQEELIRDNFYKAVNFKNDTEEIIKKLKTNMDINSINNVIDKIKVNGINKEEMKKNFDKVIEDKMNKENTVIDKNEYVKNLTYKDLVSAIETAGTYNSSFNNVGTENEKFKKLLNDIQQLKYNKSQLKG